MRFSTEIAEHRPVYKRIEPKKPEPPAIVITESEFARKRREAEQDRIWRLTVQSANGGVAPVEPKPDPVGSVDGVDLDCLDLICFAKSGGPPIVWHSNPSADDSWARACFLRSDR